MPTLGALENVGVFAIIWRSVARHSKRRQKVCWRGSHRRGLDSQLQDLGRLDPAAMPQAWWQRRPCRGRSAQASQRRETTWLAAPCAWRRPLARARKSNCQRTIARGLRAGIGQTGLVLSQRHRPHIGRRMNDLPECGCLGLFGAAPQFGEVFPPQ